MFQHSRKKPFASAVLKNLIFFFLINILCPVSLFALSPENVLIVYNSEFTNSQDLANYYANKRKIPENNIIGIPMPTDEQICREQFVNLLKIPLYDAISALRIQREIQALLLMHGVPLKVEGVKPVDHKNLEEFSTPKIKELTRLAKDLAKRIRQLINDANDIDLSPPAGAEDNLATMLPYYESIMRAAGKYMEEASQSQTPNKSIKAAELSTLLVRLAGIAPYAKANIDKAKNSGDVSLDIIKNDNVIKLNSLFETQLSKIFFQGVTADKIEDMASLVRVTKGVLGELQFWYAQNDNNPEERSSASVDSELSLLLQGSVREKDWLPNPFLSIYDPIPGVQAIRYNTLMVSRLDGPSPETIKRMIDDAIDTEDAGLNGIFYIDARGLDDGEKNTYSLYDSHLRSLANILENQTDMIVIFDDRPELFKVGDAPDAALYCGWYSLGKYIDSFSWKKGAVGYHIASSEAATLREPKSEVWCKKMLEKGVAATLGPVWEPYLQSFPRPDHFFPLLMAGKNSLIEVYYRTLPYLSWRQVLIGDPLYTPFKNKPAIKD